MPELDFVLWRSTPPNNSAARWLYEAAYDLLTLIQDTGVRIKILGRWNCELDIV